MLETLETQGENLWARITWPYSAVCVAIAASIEMVEMVRNGSTIGKSRARQYRVKSCDTDSVLRSSTHWIHRRSQWKARGWLGRQSGRTRNADWQRVA